MIGFILVPLGLLAMYGVLSRTRAERHPAAVRIGHGVLVGVGLPWIALALWRTTTTEG
jgi:hypothetical protein